MAEETRKPKSRRPAKKDSPESSVKKTDKTEKKYDLKGFRIIATGYLMIAAALFIVQITRVFTTMEAVEYGRIVVDMLAWVVVFFGATKLSRLNAEFPKLALTALAAEVCLLGEAFFTWRNLKAGMGEGAYIDFFVLFMFFMSRACLFYSYAKVLRGLSPIVENIGINGETGKTFYQTWFWVTVIVFICLLGVQLGIMFSQVAQFIAAAVGGSIAFFTQLYVCKILLDTYNAGIGRNLTKKRKQRNKKNAKNSKGSSGSPKNPNRGSTGRETMAMRKKKSRETSVSQSKSSSNKSGGEQPRTVSRKDLAKQRTDR